MSSSLNTASAGSQDINVKQERHDEAEIKELAAKMIEAHKQQSAKQQQIQQQVPRINQLPPNATAIGQTNILNYLTRKPTSTVSTVPNVSNSITSINSTAIANQKSAENDIAANGNSNTVDKKASDEESIKGHFGWETFPGKIYIPYIMRNSEKYCAVRMVEMKLLNKYLSYLHQDIYSCTCVRSYYITEAESRLFNEINTKHCDMQFGRDMFTLKDLVVRLSDACKFYQFLDVCYKKLLMGCSTPNDKCGFIRINKESVVPYTVRDTQKMVPLFYFEGETENLKLKADYLSGWDLSYLKFCCKVQGIRNELFASDSVAVISLTDIKGYFPPGTEFEDYWPSKVVDSQLLSGPKSSNTIHWTRQPTQPPPKAAIMNSIPKQNTQVRKASSGMYPNMSQQSTIQKVNTIPNISAAVQALTNNWNLANNLLTPAQQEQLLRMTQLQQQAQLRQHVQNMSQNISAHNYNQFMTSTMPMTSRTTSQNQAIPPPLVRSSQSQAAHMSNCASGSPTLRSNNTLPFINPELSIFATSNNDNLQRHVSYPKTPSTSITIGSPSRASPKCPQSKHPPPALIPVNSSSTNSNNLSHIQYLTKEVEILRDNFRNQVNEQHDPYILSANLSYPSKNLTKHIGRNNVDNTRYKSVITSRTAQDVIDLSSPPRSSITNSSLTQPYHQQKRTAASSMNNGRTTTMTPTTGHRANNMQQSLQDRLISIPEMQMISAPYKAYDVTKQMIDNKAVICINKNPYATNNDLLMTLSDLKDTFFPYISLDVCRKVLSALDITLFKGNRLQYQALQDAGKINIDGMPLVPVMDVMTFMPQLSYMVRGQIQESNANKRARIS